MKDSQITNINILCALFPCVLFNQNCTITVELQFETRINGWSLILCIVSILWDLTYYITEFVTLFSLWTPIFFINTEITQFFQLNFMHKLKNHGRGYDRKRTIQFNLDHQKKHRNMDSELTGKVRTTTVGNTERFR